VVGQENSEKDELMRVTQMKVLGSLERGTMYAVETVVKRAIMLGVFGNQKIQIGRSIPKGFILYFIFLYFFKSLMCLVILCGREDP
jgi:hypothetical protein